jgi:hypothetical protein
MTWGDIAALTVGLGLGIGGFLALLAVAFTWGTRPGRSAWAVFPVIAGALMWLIFCIAVTVKIGVEG